MPKLLYQALADELQEMQSHYTTKFARAALRKPKCEADRLTIAQARASMNTAESIAIRLQLLIIECES